MVKIVKIKLDETLQRALDKTTKRPTFLSVVSGKGGVGKSTVSVNLAVALAEQNKRVGLIDADIYGFSIPSLMNVRDEPQTVNGKMIPVEKFGVKIMSSGFLRQDNQPITLRGPMLGKIIKTFLHEVDWGSLDYLIFDLPPGTGDIPLDLHDLLETCKEIVVTTPNDTAAEVAFRAGAMTAKTGHEIVGVVENMSYLTCPDCDSRIHAFTGNGGHKLATALRSPLLAQIPLKQPGLEMRAPGVFPKETEIGLIYRKLADYVLGFSKPAQKNA